MTSIGSIDDKGEMLVMTFTRLMPADAREVVNILRASSRFRQIQFVGCKDSVDEIKTILKNRPESVGSVLFRDATVCLRLTRFVAKLMRSGTAVHDMTFDNVAFTSSRSLGILAGACKAKDSVYRMEISRSTLTKEDVEGLRDALPHPDCRIFSLVFIDNRIDLGHAHILSKGVRRMHHLDISGNELGYYGVRYFLIALSESPDLRSLSLGDNGLDVSYTKTVVKTALASLPALERLNCRDSQMSPKSIAKLNICYPRVELAL